MPGKGERVTLFLEPEVARQLRAQAALRGLTTSGLVTDLLAKMKVVSLADPRLLEAAGRASVDMRRRAASYAPQSLKTGRRRQS